MLIRLQNSKMPNDTITVGSAKHQTDEQGITVAKKEAAEILINTCGFTKIGEVADIIVGGEQLIFPRSKQEFFELCKRLGLAASDLVSMASTLREAESSLLGKTVEHVLSPQVPAEEPPKPMTSAPEPEPEPDPNDPEPGTELEPIPDPNPDAEAKKREQSTQVTIHDSKDRLLAVATRLGLGTKRMRRMNKSAIIDQINQAAGM